MLRRTVIMLMTVTLGACCQDEFDLSSDGQGSMAGATPTQSEINIACQRSKANMKTKCETICAQNAQSTDPSVRDYTKGEMVRYSECQTVPDATRLSVNAFHGGKCKCCK